MEEIYLLHKLKAEKGSLVHTFVSILEKRVGRDFYFHLYNIYNNFHTLIGDQGKLNSLVADNNLLLGKYSVADKALKQKMQDNLSTKAYSKFEQFLDFNFAENADIKILESKESYAQMFDAMLTQLDLIKKSNVLQKEIHDMRLKLKASSKSIKFSYESLRELGEVKIFTMATKNECCKEFIRLLNNKRSLNIFNALWKLALNEAQILIDCANKAMKHTVENKTGKEFLTEEEKQTVYACFEKFEKSGNVFATLTDVNLCKIMLN